MNLQWVEEVVLKIERLRGKYKSVNTHPSKPNYEG